MEFELATLTPEQHAAINRVESETGLVLIAYTPYQPEGPDGRAEALAAPRGHSETLAAERSGYDFEFATEPDPTPEVLAALNETYRPANPVESATRELGPVARRRRHRRLREL